jgi:predicted GIY-YIG superfamily endonuclease
MCTYYNAQTEAIYTGHTDNMESRLIAHQMGTYSGYTFPRLPVKLVFVEDCVSRDAAFAKERQIKGWSRAKKEALISGDWDKLTELANMKNAQPGGPSTSSG